MLVSFVLLRLPTPCVKKKLKIFFPGKQWLGVFNLLSVKMWEQSGKIYTDIYCASENKTVFYWQNRMKLSLDFSHNKPW